MKYCNKTKNEKIVLSIENLHVLKWYINSSFAIHPDFRSQTGGVMIFGKGAVQSISRKQN